MTKFIPTTMLLAIIRHILTTAGGGLVISGHIDAENLEIGIGAVMTLVGLGWSLFDKKAPKE